MFTYIFDNQIHTDISHDYMQQLGMDDIAIDAVISMHNYELSQYAVKRQAAYQQLSDPLFIEWQYELAMGSQNTMVFEANWLNSIFDIKAKYPKVIE